MANFTGPDECVTQIIPDGDCSKHILTLKQAFIDEYGTRPEFIARAPGRVNLIGEHIDYCGYAVLPMALEQDILIAFARTDTKEVRACNVSSNTYAKYRSSTDTVKVDKSEPRWYNYVLCGYLGVVEHFKLGQPCGMDLCVVGTVPPSAGLSSSSALVCAAAIATLHANGLSLSKKELASLCAHSERYVGTEGGGMDQAIAFLAEHGTAKLIEFNPIKATDVKLPAGATFVIANSCADINKAATSDFNTRVVECRLAAQILAKFNNLDWRSFRKLEDVRQALGIPLVEMAKTVGDTFHQAPYTKEEVCNILGVTADELNKTTLSENTYHVETFCLFQRAMHVFTEANRVWEFKRICNEGASDALEKLGALMNASHSSCRDLYECSHPNLDELVEVAIHAGAVGSRLTGAGWGGCTVSLVPVDKIPTFLENIKHNFYQKSASRMQNVEESLFPTQPGGGAVIYKLQ